MTFVLAQETLVITRSGVRSATKPHSAPILRSSLRYLAQFLRAPGPTRSRCTPVTSSCSGSMASFLLSEQALMSFPVIFDFAEPQRLNSHSAHDSQCGLDARTSGWKPLSE